MAKLGKDYGADVNTPADVLCLVSTEEAGEWPLEWFFDFGSDEVELIYNGL
jgi:hypothetical protein